MNVPEALSSPLVLAALVGGPFAVLVAVVKARGDRYAADRNYEAACVKADADLQVARMNREGKP